MTGDEDADAGTLGVDVSLNRKQAALAVAPFLALGLGDVVLLLFWGLDPLWGFVILPPILFISVLAWIGFRSGFIADRPGTENRDPGSGSDPDHDYDREDAVRSSD